MIFCVMKFAYFADLGFCSFACWQPVRPQITHSPEPPPPEWRSVTLHPECTHPCPAQWMARATATAPGGVASCCSSMARPSLPPVPCSVPLSTSATANGKYGREWLWPPRLRKTWANIRNLELMGKILGEPSLEARPTSRDAPKTTAGPSDPSACDREAFRRVMRPTPSRPDPFGCASPCEVTSLPVRSPSPSHPSCGAGPPPPRPPLRSGAPGPYFSWAVAQRRM